MTTGRVPRARPDAVGGVAGGAAVAAAVVAAMVAAVATTMGAVSLLAAGAGPTRTHPEGPLPGFTGGFGEPDCTTCHEAPRDRDARAILHLHGVPPEYCPGRSYPLTVRIRREGMGGAGFQLTARRAEGEEAGRAAGHLRPTGPGVAVDRVGDPPVLYVRQTLEGSVPSDGAAAWRVDWVAPGDAVGPVFLHLAANAADGDGTEFGDVVETLVARSDSPGHRGTSLCAVGR